MPINFKRTQDMQLQFSIFGKLPRRADFIRINATHPAALDVDQQLADSLKYISLENEWQHRYLAMPASEFIFFSHDQKWAFVGVAMPSHDEASRHYPLVAGMCVPSEVIQGTEAEFVLANELFFSGLKDQLKSAADNSVEMLACRQFLEDQMAFSQRAGADLELAAQLLDRHMAKTAAWDLDRSLQDQNADLESMILAFAFYLQMSRRYGNSMPGQLFLLPLPTGLGEEILGASVWLSLCRAATQSQGSNPIYFAFVSKESQRYLALSFSKINEQQLAMLWGKELDSRQIINAGDMQSPWRSHQAYAEASYILGRQLSDPTLSLLKLRDIVFKVTETIN